jgi:hypothetical protein
MCDVTGTLANRGLERDESWAVCCDRERGDTIEAFRAPITRVELAQSGRVLRSIVKGGVLAL